jgi:hypothetical protein
MWTRSLKSFALSPAERGIIARIHRRLAGPLRDRGRGVHADLEGPELVEVPLDAALIGAPEALREALGVAANEVEDALSLAPRELLGGRLLRGLVGGEVVEEGVERLLGADRRGHGLDAAGAVIPVRHEVAAVRGRDAQIPARLDAVREVLERRRAADRARHDLIRRGPADIVVHRSDAREQGPQRLNVKIVGPAARGHGAAVHRGPRDHQARDDGDAVLDAVIGDRGEGRFQIVIRADGVRHVIVVERVVVGPQGLTVEAHEEALRDLRGLRGRAAIEHDLEQREAHGDAAHTREERPAVQLEGRHFCIVLSYSSCFR